MSDITKEEIAIMIEVQTKTVVNLETIATALKAIVDEQKAITDNNRALKDELTSGILKSKLDKMHFDVIFCKYLLGSVGAIVLVAAVILKFITF